MKIEFKCKNCGGDRVEELIVDAVAATSVTGVSGEGLQQRLVFGDTDVINGEVDRFRCADCGVLISRSTAGLLAAVDLVPDAAPPADMPAEMSSCPPTRDASNDCGFVDGAEFRRKSAEVDTVTASIDGRWFTVHLDDLPCLMDEVRHYLAEYGSEGEVDVKFTFGKMLRGALEDLPEFEGW